MDILIIDDDPFVCASLQTILQAQDDIEVLGTGTSGQQAVELYRRYEPDILLIDIQMKGMTGLEAARQILAQWPLARILFLTTFSDNDYIRDALQMGAKGYLIKQDIEAIAPALRAVYSGQSVFGDEVVHKLPDLMGAPAGPDFSGFQLSEREREVTELVALGLSNREIADRLFLSEGTVRNYLSAILEKLDLRDRTQLAVFYYRQK